MTHATRYTKREALDCARRRTDAEDIRHSVYERVSGSNKARSFFGLRNIRCKLNRFTIQPESEDPPPDGSILLATFAVTMPKDED